MQQHGFARNLEWEIGSTSADLQPDERDPEVELVLTDNDYTRAMWCAVATFPADTLISGPRHQASKTCAFWCLTVLSTLTKEVDGLVAPRSSMVATSEHRGYLHDHRTTVCARTVMYEGEERCA